jgi:hypothetical protein
MFWEIWSEFKKISLNMQLINRNPSTKLGKIKAKTKNVLSQDPRHEVVTSFHEHLQDTGNSIRSGNWIHFNCG